MDQVCRHGALTLRKLFTFRIAFREHAGRFQGERFAIDNYGDKRKPEVAGVLPAAGRLDGHDSTLKRSTTLGQYVLLRRDRLIQNGIEAVSGPRIRARQRRLQTNHEGCPGGSLF